MGMCIQDQQIAADIEKGRFHGWCALQGLLHRSRGQHGYRLLQYFVLSTMYEFGIIVR